MLHEEYLIYELSLESNVSGQLVSQGQHVSR